MNISLNELTLPDDSVWRDELAWAAVVQTLTPTLTGALIVEEAPLPMGRPITLVGVATRGLILQLKDLEDQVNPVMTLTLLDGVGRTVIWRRPGVQATPIDEYADPDDADPYNLTLNFTEIE